MELQRRADMRVFSDDEVLALIPFSALGGPRFSLASATTTIAIITTQKRKKRKFSYANTTLASPPPRLIASPRLPTPQKMALVTAPSSVPTAAAIRRLTSPMGSAN